MDGNEDPQINIQKNIIEDYYEGTLLGKGAFGSAFLCNKQSENNAKYVIKVIDLSKITKYAVKRKMYDSVMNEIFILSILRAHCDEYIMCYVKSIILDPIIYIVCEYLENYNTLDKLFLDNSVETIAKICNNLLLGLKKLHSLNVCHRDIKPANIMYNVESLNIKYIDFGFSTLSIDNTIKSNTSRKVGTPNYLYPGLYTPVDLTFELLQRADNFSLGMVFFTLLTKGKVVQLYLKMNLRSHDDVFEFNSDLQNHIQNPLLNPIYVLENQIMEYSKNNNLDYVDFATLMGLTRPQMIEDHPVKGGRRRFTLKRRKKIYLKAI